MQTNTIHDGKGIRDIGDHSRRVCDPYINDQNYVPRKQKIIKPTMKWKAPANKPKEFEFSVDTNQSNPPWEPQTGGLVYKFGNTKKELWRNPNQFCQDASLFLGKPRWKLKIHKGIQTRADLLGSHKQEAQYLNVGTLRRKELHMNPNQIPQDWSLLLGKPK